MKRRTVKMTAVMMVSAILTIAATSAAFAGTWKQDAKGWWWQEDNGSYPISQWKWLDGNQDGIAECYYFDSTGYMMANTTTPDGYIMNGDGQWMENGVAKTQGTQASKPSLTSDDVKGTTSEGSWEQVGNRWKFKKPNGSYVIDQLWLIDSDGDGIYNMYSFDEDGILYDGSSDRFDHGQFGGYGGNKFGTFYSDGRMIANNYHGDRQKEGPYEVIKKNGLWTDGSGMIGNNNYLNIPITDNYYIDALGIQVGIDLYQATLDVSGTIYKN